MIDYPNLTNLPEINFKSKGRPELKELAEYIDKMKADLFTKALINQKYQAALNMIQIRDKQQNNLSA